jgi:hypothetical protein
MRTTFLKRPDKRIWPLPGGRTGTIPNWGV